MIIACSIVILYFLYFLSYHRYSWTTRRQRRRERHTVQRVSFAVFAVCADDFTWLRRSASLFQSQDSCRHSANTGRRLRLRIVASGKKKKKCSARSPDRRRALLSAGQQSTQSKLSTALPYTDTQAALLVIFLVSGLVFVCAPPLAPSYQPVLLANYLRKGNRLDECHQHNCALV